MKKTGKTGIVVLLALMLVILGACGLIKGPSDYVKGYLDLLTRGETAAYAKLTKRSEEDVEKEYQAFLDSLKGNFDQEGVTDATRDKLADVYVEVLKKSKYTVHRSKKTSEGFEVVVDVEPITGLYQGLTNEVAGEMPLAVESGALTMDNSADWTFSTMADKMSARVETLSYGEAQSVTVQIAKGENGYEVGNLQSVREEMEKLFIDQSDVYNNFDAAAFMNDYMKVLVSGGSMPVLDTLLNTDKVKVSDEAKQKLADACAQVLRKSRYTVHGAEETDEGYAVTVDVEPITGLFQGVLDGFFLEMGQAALSGDVTLDNAYDWAFDKIAERMLEQLDSLNYGPAQSVTVRFVKGGFGYEIEDQENVTAQIGSLFIDIGGFQLP